MNKLQNRKNHKIYYIFFTIFTLVVFTLLIYNLFYSFNLFNLALNNEKAKAQILSGSFFTVKKEDNCSCNSSTECFGGYCCYIPGTGSICQSSPCPPIVSDLNHSFQNACSQSRIPKLSWNASIPFPYDFEIQICSDNNCNNVLVSESKSNSYNSFWNASCLGSCNIAPYNQINFGGITYYFRVKVKDSSGTWSNWATSSFVTKSNPYPQVSFSCNGKNCSDIKPSAGELIALESTSQYFTDSISCNWDIPANVTIEEGSINSCQLKIRLNNNQNTPISLYVTDSSGNGPCQNSQMLQVKPRLPLWREIFGR